MKKRDKQLKKARISESPVDWATFKRAKNEVCKFIRSAKVNLQKLLGVKLDSHLNFTEHIDDICKKVSRR